MSKHGFLRGAAATEAAGLQSFASVKRFGYLRKNQKPRFWIAVVPIIEGYEPRPIVYHRHLANINIKGSSYDVSAQCKLQDCPACRAAYRQAKEIPYEKRGREFYKIDKQKTMSQYFLVYEVMMSSQGSCSIADGAEPLLLEYRYNRSGICPDWENFMDAYEAAIADGMNPEDPSQAVVFEVTQQKEQVGRGNMMRTAYKHTALSSSVSLPVSFREDVEARAKLNDLYIDLDSEDIEIIVSTDAKAKQLAASTDLTAEQIGEQLLESYKTVKSSDFQRILSYFETKDSDKVEPVREAEGASVGSYADQANQSLAGPTTQTPAADSRPSGGASADDGAVDVDVAAARKRILEMRKKS